MQYELEQKFRVTSAEADFRRKLKISSLINQFIQIAWQHAEIMGYGVKNMDDNGIAWMLSRLQLKINKIPGWDEKITIETWPKGIRRLFYLRDFTVRDDNKNTIANSTSEWLMIDTKARRPKLKDPLNEGFTINQNRHAMAGEVPSLEPLKNSDEPTICLAKYSDLDLNRHLTATRYVDWMFDTFDPEYFANYSCSEMILHFVHEVAFNQRVILKREANKENDSYSFEFISEDSKQIIFRGKLIFEKSATI